VTCLASPGGANLDAIFLEQREPVRGCLLAKIAQGLGAYFLLGVLIEAGHSYFGVCRESPAFIVLFHLRMAVYLACVNYWIISLWREKRRVRAMTPEMREKCLLCGCG
jgi:hypothetical protein